MKAILIFAILAAATSVFAQDMPIVQGKEVFIQTGGPVGAGGAIATRTIGAFENAPGAPVQGAPYSATVTNENIQTLADGNRIVHTSTGNIARDSLGRTRQDAPLPTIGNLSAANAPHLVFIRDPVAQTSYSLDLTDKTAQKMPMAPTGPGGPGPLGPPGGKDTFFIRSGDIQLGVNAASPDSLPMPPPMPPPMAIQQKLVLNDQSTGSTEDLGSQTMEGVLVTGVRTTRTIPAGQIGNEKPISIVTEVWTSPDLKTVVYSKRSDPQMGEMTFRLTDIVRAEPDASLFTVPADFKIMDGPQAIIYRSNQ